MHFAIFVSFLTVKHHLCRKESCGICLTYFVQKISNKKEKMNVVSPSVIDIFGQIFEQMEKDDEVKAIIFISGKKDFMAGADLRKLANPPEDKRMMYDGLLQQNRQLREFEKGGKPFVAVINGNALGGGLELALTCHHRIAVNNPKIKIINKVPAIHSKETVKNDP